MTTTPDWTTTQRCTGCRRFVMKDELFADGNEKERVCSLLAAWHAETPENPQPQFPTTWLSLPSFSSWMKGITGLPARSTGREDNVLGASSFPLFHKPQGESTQT